MVRGRKPKPTALRAVEGNPGKRPLNDDEPKPKYRLPSCPPHLDTVARREWRRIGRELNALNLMSGLDRAALAAYCVAWSQWVKATRELQGEGEGQGMLTRTPNGHTQVSPWFTIATQSCRVMSALLVEFGLTPSSRSRMNVSRIVGGASPDGPTEQERRLADILNRAHGANG